MEKLRTWDKKSVQFEDRENIHLFGVNRKCFSCSRKNRDGERRKAHSKNERQGNEEG